MRVDMNFRGKDDFRYFLFSNRMCCEVHDALIARFNRDENAQRHGSSQVRINRGKAMSCAI